MDEQFTCTLGTERYADLHMKSLYIELHRLVCQVCLKQLETRNSSCKNYTFTIEII